MSIIREMLVVGGSGYLGSHLRQQLADLPFKITYTSRSNAPESVVIDFGDSSTFSNLGKSTFDCVFILASSLKGLGTTDFNVDSIRVNDLGLAEFLHYIKVNQVTRKIIYMSSTTVYAKENNIPVTEDGRLDPISTYGFSKMLAEQIVAFYCKHNQMQGVILRIPGIYGGNRKNGFIYNTALRCIRNEKIEIETTSLGYWETVNVADLCSWLAQFLQKYKWRSDLDTFNFGYGRNTDIVECAHLIRRFLDSSSEISTIGPRGYCDFYLNNLKAKSIIAMDDTYENSLRTYTQLLQR